MKRTRKPSGWCATTKHALSLPCCSGLPCPRSWVRYRTSARHVGGTVWPRVRNRPVLILWIGLFGSDFYMFPPLLSVTTLPSMPDLFVC